MAAINDAPGPSIRRAGVPKQKKYSLRVDMTPMVDLGFLLITFFIMTTTLSKPTVMELYMPKDGGPPTDLGETSALTVLIDDESLIYYEGKWEDALANNRIYKTAFSGKDNIRDVINRKQGALDRNPKMKTGRDELMVLIKPDTEATHKGVVDMLDEMSISMVKKYALVKLAKEEKEWLENKEQ